MNCRIAICDDEAEQAEKLTEGRKSFLIIFLPASPWNDGSMHFPYYIIY